MTKVIIDAFDTEEQAVAFVAWLKQKMDAGECQLLTAHAGREYVDWDGVDHTQTDNEQITLNICTSDVEPVDGYIYE